MYKVLFVFLLVLVLGSPASAVVMSTFDTGPDGWFVQDLQQGTLNPVGTYAVSWSPSGGKPGGYIFETDPSPFGFTFGAPAKFLGDQSAFIGQNLTFDLSNNDPFQDATDGLVILRTTGGFLLFDGGIEPGAAFTSFTVPLEAGAGWTWAEDGFINSRPAVEADFNNVMSNLTALLIRGDWGGTVDTSQLDNVRLGTPVPEPSTLFLLVSGLVY